MSRDATHDRGETNEERDAPRRRTARRLEATQSLANRQVPPSFFVKDEWHVCSTAFVGAGWRYSTGFNWERWYDDGETFTGIRVCRRRWRRVIRRKMSLEPLPDSVYFHRPPDPEDLAPLRDESFPVTNEYLRELSANLSEGTAGHWTFLSTLSACCGGHHRHHNADRASSGNIGNAPDEYEECDNEPRTP